MKKIILASILATAIMPMYAKNHKPQCDVMPPHHQLDEIRIRNNLQQQGFIFQKMGDRKNNCLIAIAKNKKGKDVHVWIDGRDGHVLHSEKLKKQSKHKGKKNKKLKNKNKKAKKLQKNQIVPAPAPIHQPAMPQHGISPRY